MRVVVPLLACVGLGLAACVPAPGAYDPSNPYAATPYSYAPGEPGDYAYGAPGYGPEYGAPGYVSPGYAGPGYASPVVVPEVGLGVAVVRPRYYGGYDGRRDFERGPGFRPGYAGGPAFRPPPGEFRGPHGGQPGPFAAGGPRPAAPAPQPPRRLENLPNPDPKKFVFGRPG